MNAKIKVGDEMDEKKVGRGIFKRKRSHEMN